MSSVCEPLKPNCFSVGLAHKFAFIAKGMDASMSSAIERVIRPESVDDLDESLADLFSVRMGPLYKADLLPREIEDFIVWMLHQKENTIGGMVMDEKPRKPRSAEKLPFLYKVGVFPLPMPPEGVISWFDREKNEYVIFKSYTDKFRYALGKMLIPEDLQNRILEECHGRQWSGWDIGFIKNFYYGGWGYDEIIDYFKDSQEANK